MTHEPSKDDDKAKKGKQCTLSVTLDGTTRVFKILQSPIPTGMPKESKDRKVEPIHAMVPFWFVEAEHHSKANTVLGHETHTVGNATVQVPILTNPKAIKKGDPITFAESA